MADNHNVVRRVLAVVFVAFILVGFTRNGSYTTIGSLFNYFTQEDFEAEDATTVSTIENDFTSNMLNENDLIDLNGQMAAHLKMQGLYSAMGMYITDDKFIVSASDYTTTDYEYEQMVAFKEFLDQNGIKLLYVNEPTKYLDDSLFSEEFGVESYCNRNADTFLKRIKDAGVNTLDLRDTMKEEGLEVSDLFYRTDHHWTVPAGLWATQNMAKALNKYCGYDIDTSIYDLDNYEAKTWKNCWLGEQGRKVAEAYVGLDDYTELKPKFDTSFTFRNGKTDSFDHFINEDVFNTENDVYENDSWHYAYTRLNCYNNKVTDGKVLMLGDSYSCVTQPFLAIGVHACDSMILRAHDDKFDLQKYILDRGYDTVIVSYAEFMLGAHDDPTSDNYRMYTFE